MQPVTLKTWISRFGAGLAVVAALWALQLYALPSLNDYYQIVLINAGIAVILAVSLNLINGITGQFSLGHAGFMAIGAYVSAYFTKEIGTQILDPINFALGITVGALAAGVAGLLVGLPSLRLRGDYLAIVTLGFNQIIVSIIRNLEIVGGASGYTDIPRFTSFAWTFALVFGCILTVRNIAVSSLGRSMRAVRDDEIAAEAAGINTTQIKVLAFAFSAMWAGVAGALQAHFIQVANPSDFTFLRSVEVVVSVVLGGLGSITGSALAAVGLRVLEEVLRDVPGVIWTSLGLIALATYWSYPRHRAAIARGFAGVAGWLIGPVVALIVVAAAYFFAYDFLAQSKGALRYLLYALILIVLMLLRPQGLLGRGEWSLRRRVQVTADERG
ncbi:MAG: branched-chain amino acid ABC transporter permease [Armatimonadetes bacterium]|nr:branched-chain amino acid ABC transporter permease [Armatimonadota bacterium]